MEQKILIEAKNLYKSYPVDKTSELSILEDINLSVHQGEFVAVMGASGSGKSTLLYNISGMERPTSGSVALLGHQLEELSEAELANLRLGSLGFVFQQHNLLRNLTLFDNIALPAYRAKKEKQSSIDQRVRKLMEHLGIEELAEKDITQASGGQLQRVAICRALINNPRIVFGDEPTGALNSGTTEEVMDILAEINGEGSTVLLVTHDVKVAARARRVLYMRDGRIVAERQIGVRDSVEQRIAELSQWLTQQGF